MPADIPDLDVRVNGAGLPLGARADVRSVTVEEDLEALSMFTLTLYNWDEEQLQVSWSDSPLFAVGNEVEIWLGYVDDLHKVMVAEITNLEPSFTSDQPPLLTVRGYDHRHRLARGRRTRTFTRMKDSAIAGQIARESGLRAKVADSKVTVDYVIQSNQTNWDFLRQRAALIGYDVHVRDKVLYFEPSHHTDQPALRLTIGDDVTAFSPRLSAMGQLGDVSVRAWDVRAKQVVVGSARPGSAMGGKPSGTTAARKAFGTASEPTVDLPVHSRAQADPAASGRFDAMALAYVQGELVTRGRPQLHAGTVVEVGGAGRNFSGPYYLTSVTHAIAPETGYQTTLTVRRNAA